MHFLRVAKKIQITRQRRNKVKYSPPFYCHPCRPRCHRPNLALGVFRCLGLSLFTHSDVWANSSRAKLCANLKG